MGSILDRSMYRNPQNPVYKLRISERIMEDILEKSEPVIEGMVQFLPKQLY